MKLTGENQNIRSCMGGWCSIRDVCTHYGRPSKLDPVERMCEPGRDGLSFDHPIVIRRAAGSWQHSAGIPLLRAAEPFDLLGAAA